VALSHYAHPATDIEATLDPSLLEGPRAPVSTGMQIVPAGDSVFRAGDRGSIISRRENPGEDPRAGSGEREAGGGIPAGGQRE